jgi:hypothetical protein
MTSGPEAHVGEVLGIPFERPRNRLDLMDSPAFYEMRERLVTFLEDQGHERAPLAAAPKAPKTSGFFGLLRSRVVD